MLKRAVRAAAESEEELIQNLTELEKAFSKRMSKFPLDHRGARGIEDERQEEAVKRSTRAINGE